MTENAAWSVFILRSPKRYGGEPTVERFFGGEIDEPYGQNVLAIYLTAEDAKGYEAQAPEHGGLKSAPPYKKPIAWVVHRPDTGAYEYDLPSYGGRVHNVYDDDVVAIYRTEEESTEYLSQRPPNTY